ncbi:MAG: hypothetical protein HC901_03370 [Bdellovibrionaceae bacterium]|nr:hypothetical protein [Pseudobdellovibrionaceae bacterium]
MKTGLVFDGEDLDLRKENDRYTFLSGAVETPRGALNSTARRPKPCSRPHSDAVARATFLRINYPHDLAGAATSIGGWQAKSKPGTCRAGSACRLATGDASRRGSRGMWRRTKSSTTPGCRSSGTSRRSLWASIRQRR